MRKKLIQKIRKLRQMPKSLIENEFVLDSISDIKRNWVDIESFATKHISPLIKGKHNAGKFIASI